MLAAADGGREAIELSRLCLDRQQICEPKPQPQHD
jgi:hypothetical protein